LARRPTASLDDLLAQAGWLNRLARQLVRDGDLAADVAQDAWISASQAPPEAGRPVRPWLAEVLRNVIRMRLRSERRRTRWETASRDAQETSIASPEAVQERLELHRLIVENVQSLEEPLRAVVLLRFFEERSSAEIARLTDVPAGTVRWRLKRALDRLRFQLDERFGGDRRRWAVLLVPAARASQLAELAKGTLLMAKMKVSTAALVALALALLVSGGWIGTRALRHLVDDGHKIAARAPAGARSIRSGWSLPAAEPGIARGHLRGVVRSSQGSPVPGALLVLVKTGSDENPPPVSGHTQSDRTGVFHFGELEPGEYALIATADGFLPSRRGGIMVQSKQVAAADLRLDPGGVSLAGRVLDAGGGVISGAMVTAILTRSTARAPSDALVLRGLTDDRGHYRLSARTGNHQLRVQAAGYAPAEAWLSLKEDRTRDFELTPAARVSGRVLERLTGQPVADAEVLLIVEESAGRPPTPSAPTRTDASGRFLFTSVEAGRYGLSARRGPLVSVPVDVIVNATDTAAVDLRVDPAASVSGRVLDETGMPLAGTIVQLHKRSFFTLEPALKTRSAKDGRYLIEGVLPGRYLARALEQSFPAVEGRMITVSSRDLPRVDLTLSRPAVVGGRVVRSDRRPGVDLEVHVLSDHKRPNSRTVTNTIAATDTDGGFRAMVMPGKIQIRVRDPDDGSALEELGVVGEGETRQVSLQLRADGSASVSGRVTLSDGRPGEGVTLTARGGRATVFARADQQGGFTLTGLDPGAVTVEASADEESRHLGPWNWARQEIAIREGEHRTGIALTLPARGRIAGRVLGPGGLPMGEVTVSAAFENAGRTIVSAAKRVSAGRDGSFAIDGLPRGPHTVSAMHPDYPDAETRAIETGTEDAILRFRPAATIAGHAVDGTGRAVSDFFLVAKPKERRTNAPMVPRPVRDAGGSFRLSRLAAGTYTLEATTSTGLRARTEISLAEGEQRSGLRLVLEEVPEPEPTRPGSAP
jgi:RNA polymerase sigma-70 factor (ECF subfamily)